MTCDSLGRISWNGLKNIVVEPC